MTTIETPPQHRTVDIYHQDQLPPDTVQVTILANNDHTRRRALARRVEKITTAALYLSFSLAVTGFCIVTMFDPVAGLSLGGVGAIANFSISCIAQFNCACPRIP